MMAIEPPPVNGVSVLLGDDHVRIDAGLAGLHDMLSDGEIDRAAYHFDDLESDLRRHIDAEEMLLFPLFEARTHVHGPAHCMRLEHREIVNQLEQLHAALDGGHLLQAREVLSTLRTLLTDHNRKEERIIYPKTDAALSPSERDDFRSQLVRALHHELHQKSA